MAQKKYLDQNGLSYLWGKIKGYVNDRFVRYVDGRVVSFSDSADGKPLKALTVGIEPVQAGSGDPSPDNVRPITGWTEAKVTRCGKNLLDYETAMSAAGFVKQGDEWFARQSSIASNKLLWENTSGISGSITLTYSYKYNTTPSQGARFVFLYSDGTHIDNYAGASTTYVTKAITSNAQKTLSKISFTYGTGSVSTWIKDIQIELGSTTTDYEPYTGETYSVEFPSEAGTVYGGTLDVTRGLLTVDSILFERNTSTMNNSESYPGWINAGIKQLNPVNGTVANAIVNIGTKYSVNVNGNNDIIYLGMSIYHKTQTEWKALAIDVQIAVKLAAPITYQLTPTEITTLLGANTVWADTGDILELQYIRGSAGDIEYIVSQSDAGTVNGHTVQSDVPANAAFTDTTYTLSQDVLDGHKITLTPSAGNPATITIPDNDTTYSPATSSVDGLMSAADKEKLDSMSSTRVYDDTLEYKTQSGWSPVDITLQPFTAAAEASVEWELGAIASSSGANSDSSTRLRTVSYLPSGIVSITPASGYRFVLVAYDDGTYIGAWNGTSYAKTATWLTAKVEASDLGQHDFRIVLARNPDSGTMTVDEKSNIVITQNVRMTVNDLARRMTSLEKALMGIDLSDPDAAIYALALRVAQLEAHAILDSGYPSESSS